MPVNLEKLVKEVVEPGTWDKNGNRIQGRAGTIIVTHTPEVHRSVRQLLEDMRSRKGQVQRGERMTEQVAQGQVSEQFREKDYLTGLNTDDNELRRFVRDNYKWYLGDKGDSGERFLVEKLYANTDQKVMVSSVNLKGDADDAEALGIRFTTGNNDTRWTVVDEAQFRTLMEMSAKKAAGAGGENQQETIVGTDALLANGMRGNVRYSGDAGNRLDVNDNGIDLAHERYLLIDNGKYLTAVKAGPMVNWRQKLTPVVFFNVPQGIEVPRVGQLVKLEKTLVEPADEMVISTDYKWVPTVSTGSPQAGSQSKGGGR